ncbi:MAG: TlpA disulfide reductase family protein [Crocinitomicaceae bacterium]|nr:TlpA disulfide reductase family protein [Crocinitomicaceae bacterium]
MNNLKKLLLILFGFTATISCKNSKNIVEPIEKIETPIIKDNTDSTRNKKNDSENNKETKEEHSTNNKNEDANLKGLPSIELKDLNGKTVNISSLGLNGPIVISFWATWCSPCKKELNTINEIYQDWQDETGVTLVAVSIDDSKTKNNVPVYVNGKGWEYIVLLDPNGDLKRAMGVNNVPHTFLVNTNGKIVYSHNNYAPGDEDLLYEEILNLK